MPTKSINNNLYLSSPRVSHVCFKINPTQNSYNSQSSRDHKNPKCSLCFLVKILGFLLFLCSFYHNQMASKPVPKILIIFTLTCTLTSTYSLPFVVFHGLSEKCSTRGVKRLIKLLSKSSGSEGYCIEIGNGIWDSWFMPLLEQTTIACEKVVKLSVSSFFNLQVKEMDKLSEGYNIVGLSQVKNFISLAGPHAGTASIPFCGSGLICILEDCLVKLEIYRSSFQENLAPASYIKIPTEIDDYLQGCSFLPKLNNERVNDRNSTYKKRFASLQNLVLIMFEHDRVLVPKETSLFGYFPDGSWSTVLPAQETKLYTEDWIGLKTLDEAGKVKFINMSGGHLHISTSDAKKYIVPYLEDEVSIQLTITNPYYIWLSSIWDFMKESVGLAADRLLLHTLI
ncbi:palmitoyl-protein thioesterase 1-like isoform X3 [Camellia sinensis]|uniref:palmitoyl-protein thioesterase 1-like isoform X3 n=1 Tax=Camellia sinensis TaxID=4442 RepID=UPI001036C94F|nr:palmitoyl-protein thioesterase 1-like isoform X3 [Camellia sinensis]